MIAIGFFAFEIVAIILSIVFEKSKWLPIIVFTVGVFVCVGCNNTNDVLAMEFRYGRNQFSDLPIGFQKIVGIFINTGKSFFCFKAVYAIVCLSAMYLFYRKQTEYLGMACVMFFVFPFNSFYGQIRNGISAIIAMIALCWYIKSDKKGKTLIYIALILIAALIHPSILFYLLAVFAVANIDFRGYGIATFCVTVCVTVVFISNLGKTIAAVLVNSERVLRWLDFSITDNWLGSALVIIGQIVGTLLVIYARNKIINAEDSGAGKGTFSVQQADVLVRIHLLFVLLIPFYFMTHNYFRIFKYILIIDWLLFIQVIWQKKRKNYFMLFLTWGYIAALYVGQMIVENYKFTLDYFNSFDIDNLKQIF